MVVQASILMNRRLFLFSTARNPCNFDSTRTLRQVDSNASPSRLVVGIGVDSNAPPSRLNHFSESTGWGYRSRLRDATESTRGSVGVESTESRSRLGEIIHPTARIFLSKTMRFSTQKCHTFDPKLPWFWLLSMGVLMFNPQGYEIEV